MFVMWDSSFAADLFQLVEDERCGRKGAYSPDIL